MSKVIIILGPSGVGKSEISKELANTINFLHLEADVRDEDGIDLNNLRKEWDLFLHNENYTPLLGLLIERFKAAEKKGAILSLPSLSPFKTELMHRATKDGMLFIILYATAADCINSFLNREEQLGSGLGIEHWHKYNCVSYFNMSLPEFKEFRHLTFDNDVRKTNETVALELMKRIK